MPCCASNVSFLLVACKKMGAVNLSTRGCNHGFLGQLEVFVGISYRLEGCGFLGGVGGGSSAQGARKECDGEW